VARRGTSSREIGPELWKGKVVYQISQTGLFLVQMPACRGVLVLFGRKQTVFDATWS